MLLLATALASPLPEELPPDTRLLETHQGREFVRWHLEVPERDFWIEITPTDRGGAVCEGHGNELWVRLSLEESESFEWEPLPEVVDRVCERLDRVAYGADAPPPSTLSRPSVSPEPPPEPRLDARLGLVAALWAVLAGWALRSREALVLLGGALLTRLLLSPHTVVGPEAYATLTLNPGVQWMNLALSSLAPALLFAAMRPLAGRTAALAGGLLLTLAPLPVLVAATEVSAPAAATLQLAAVAGALGHRITGPAFCLASSALLLWAGPENIPFVALPMGLLLWKRRWTGAALLGIGLGVSLPSAAVDVDALMAMAWHTMVPGPGAIDRILDPLKTPAMVPLLGLGGVLWCLNRDRLSAGLVPSLAAFLTLLTVLPLETDYSQVATQSWWAGLAGMGLAAAIGWGRWPAMGLWVLFGASLFVARSPTETTAQSEEYALLRAVQPRGAWAHPQVDADLAGWAGLSPAPDEVVAGDRIWRGVRDAEQGWPWGDCPMLELEVRDATAHGATVDPSGTGTVTLGLYEAKTDCARR